MIAVFLDSIKPVEFYRSREFNENRIYYFDKLDIPHKIYNDLQEYLDCQETFKVAVLFNNITHSPSLNDKNIFLEKLESISQLSQLVILIELEKNFPVENNLDQEKVIIVVPGLVTKVYKSKFIFKPFYFEITTNLYKKLPFLLDNLNPYLPKEKFFDALLGVGRPHRDLIYKLFQDNQLMDKNIISYYKRDPHNLNNTEYIKVPEVQYVGAECNDPYGGGRPASYYGQKTQNAYIIAAEVYNQTAYSVVAETVYYNDFNMFSEKVAKPILAKRLFVVFAGQGYLNSLRYLGFKTFGEVIDESYDNELDDNRRWSMAFEQIKYLCNQDQNKILPKIRHIVDHNYEVMMHTDWDQLAVDSIIENIKKLTH